jgi:hypothetical protein
MSLPLSRSASLDNELPQQPRVSGISHYFLAKGQAKLASGRKGHRAAKVRVLHVEVNYSLGHNDCNDDIPDQGLMRIQNQLVSYARLG